MRHETQHWDQIRALLEVVSAGEGLTGLAPTVSIARFSDGQWLQVGGTTWGPAPASLTMVELDSSNLPGVYSYAVNTSALTYANGSAGYICHIVEPDNYVRETVRIHVAMSEWDEDPAAHATAGTMGRTLQVIQGLVQGNHRLKNPTYDAEGRMLTAQLVLYPTSADALADTNALDTFNVTCTYNGFGDMTSLLSRN